jgi:hypothetical protein
MARIQAVAISIELLQEIMTTGWTVGDEYVLTCTKGLPEGAKLVGSSYEHGNLRAAILEFEHESFPDLPEEATPPLMDVVFEFTKPIALEPGPCPTVE